LKRRRGSLLIAYRWCRGRSFVKELCPSEFQKKKELCPSGTYENHAYVLKISSDYLDVAASGNSLVDLY
jgi:hypothetical protein